MRVLAIWIFIIGLFTTEVWGQCQTKRFLFDYDAAGNRIKRQYLVVGTCRTAKPTQMDLDTLPFVSAQEELIPLPSIKHFYPNPVTDIATLTFTMPLDNAMLKVLDLSGNVIHEERVEGDVVSMDFSLQPTGMYVIVVQTQQGKYLTQKVSKIN